MLPRLHLVGPSWEAEQTRVPVSWSFKGSVCLEKQRRLECIFLKCLHCLESSAPHVQPRCVSTDQGEPAALPTFGHGRAFCCRGYSPPQSPRADSWVMASALAGIHGTLVFGETNCPRAVFLPLVMRLQIIFPLSSGNKGPFLHFLIDLYMMC